MNNNKHINTHLFQEISLAEMGKVTLMNRTDRKYWFHLNKLQDLFQLIKDDYFVLKINNQSILPYSSTYFDTREDLMYIAHQNGKLNRYKIRRRSYTASKMSFLEIKFKNNKGRTIKERIPSEFGENAFTPEECDFIASHSPFNTKQLQEALVNEFSRITLVNKNFKERCTIDLDLKYIMHNKRVALHNLVIVEVKAEGYSEPSPLVMALRNQRIKSSGFSKYCVGISVTKQHIKRNRFKPLLRQLEKLIQPDHKLYQHNITA